jgi:hypothetical protein
MPLRGRRWSLGASVLAGALALAAPGVARGDDTVRECIAASTDGQTLRDQGSLRAARERLLVCARDVCPGIVRSHCAKWLAEVEARTPSLVVRAQDATGADRPDAVLNVDGAPAKLDGHALALDPGEHTLTVTIDQTTKRQKLLLVEGERSRVVVVRMEPPAAPLVHEERPPAPRETTRGVPLGAWILGGAGVAMLGGALAFTFVAKGDKDTLDATCSPHCTQAATQPGRTHQAVSDVLYVAGGVAVAGAMVWAFVWPSRSESEVRVGIAPTIGGAAAVVQGRF